MKETHLYSAHCLHFSLHTLKVNTTNLLNTKHCIHYMFTVIESKYKKRNSILTQ